MGCGLTMTARKKSNPPKPRPHGFNWLDEDLAPWLSGDYDICDQHEEVQVMLDLAEMLADARAEWAMKKFRVAQQEHGSPRTDEYRDPRFVVNQFSARRGFDARHE